MMRRVAVDAMGGDRAPGEIVRGAVEALQDRDDFSLVLVGDETAIAGQLESLDFDSDRMKVVHTSQVIEMAESPVDALRQKKDSSILRVAKLASSGEAEAIISAGNTGAFAAACQLKLRTLPGVVRAGIGVAIPSFHGPFVLCDCGANIQPKPGHLHQYAVMANLYAQKLLGIESPRVALLSIGEESEKGTALVKKTHELLRGEERINFIGNVEGRELFEGVCDVALCDGFVGNLMLKFVEGVAEGFIQTLSREFEREITDEATQRVARTALERVWAQHDYSEYGGAPLLGVDGISIICHGRSDSRAIRSAVGVACRFLSSDYNRAVTEQISTPAEE